VKRDDAVLVPGCGNSRLPEDMAEDGYRSIHNIDISAVVIEQQRERYQGHPHERFISFQHMNACALEFPDETFDAVIAKVRAAESFLARACARALDALSVFSPQALVDVVMCGEGHAENVANMCMEVRVGGGPLSAARR
jgi:SAM-dependent methyltransferase